MRRIWTTISDYLKWNNKAGSLTQLVDNKGNIITSPRMMAELQNRYYIEKVRKIREELPKD